MRTSNMTPAEAEAWERLAQTGLLRRALALNYHDYQRALTRAVVIVSGPKNFEDRPVTSPQHIGGNRE